MASVAQCAFGDNAICYYYNRYRLLFWAVLLAFNEQSLWFWGKEARRTYNVYALFPSPSPPYARANSTYFIANNLCPRFDIKYTLSLNVLLNNTIQYSRSSKLPELNHRTFFLNVKTLL